MDDLRTDVISACPFFVFPLLATHVHPHLGQEGRSSPPAPWPAMSLAISTFSSPSRDFLPSASSIMIDLRIPSGTSFFAIPGTPLDLVVCP